MVNPLVEDFLKGKSGMISAMGPSGSGKTHIVFGTTREPGMAVWFLLLFDRSFKRRRTMNINVQGHYVQFLLIILWITYAFSSSSYHNFKNLSCYISILLQDFLYVNV